jgi:hypothetical protein
MNARRHFLPAGEARVLGDGQMAVSGGYGDFIAEDNNRKCKLTVRQSRQLPLNLSTPPRPAPALQWRSLAEEASGLLVHAIEPSAHIKQAHARAATSNDRCGIRLERSQTQPQWS